MCSMSGTAIVTTGNPERKNIVIKLRKPLKSAGRSLAFIVKRLQAWNPKDAN